jgi:hypothetical protein
MANGGGGRHGNPMTAAACTRTTIGYWKLVIGHEIRMIHEPFVNHLGTEGPGARTLLIICARRWAATAARRERLQGVYTC